MPEISFLFLILNNYNQFSTYFLILDITSFRKLSYKLTLDFNLHYYFLNTFWKTFWCRAEVVGLFIIFCNWILNHLKNEWNLQEKYVCLITHN